MQKSLSELDLDGKLGSMQTFEC